MDDYQDYEECPEDEEEEVVPYTFEEEEEEETQPSFEVQAPDEVQEPTDEALLEDKEPVDIAEQLEQLELLEKRNRKRRFKSFWKRPPTFVYADNFGFGVQAYQPMIDYLDVKDSGGAADKSTVHLPWIEERCMRKHCARKPFHWYVNDEIDRYIDKGEKIRTQIRQNDAVGIGNVLNRTHTNWSMARKWVQLVKRSNVIDYRQLRAKIPEEGEDNVWRPSKRRPKPLEDYRLLHSRENSVVSTRGSVVPRGSVAPVVLRAPTVSRPPSPVHLRQPSPTPSRLDDLSSSLASMVRAVAQNRMEHEEKMAVRREKLRYLDEKLDGAVDHIYEQMRRINQRADHLGAGEKDPRDIELADLDLALRNRMRRAEELSAMSDMINDLCNADSARNTLRYSLRDLDHDMLGLSSRVDNMRNLRNTTDDLEIEKIKADLAARRSLSRSITALNQTQEDEEVARVLRRPPRHAELFPQPERVTPRPRDSLSKDEVISDTYARILHRAGEFGDRTSEQRRINNRARFVNVLKTRPDTADRELIVPPTRTELNIDHMAKTLATRGSFQRRWDIDAELDDPCSNINTNAQKDYCEQGALGTIRQHPSISHRVRYATHRARARSSLLGY